MLSKTTVNEIRRLKQEGASLKELALKFHCAKSTVSLYCRDVFEHPRRKYYSEQEARQIPILNRRGKPRKRYPSDGHRKLYPCISCGNSIRGRGKLCIKCYTRKRNEIALMHEEERIREREQREKAKIERLTKRFKPAVIHVCLQSPNQRHHWEIDATNHGVCIYCHAEKDFGVVKVTAFRGEL